MIASLFNTVAEGDDGEKLLYNSFRDSLVRVDEETFKVYQGIARPDIYGAVDTDDPVVGAIIADLLRGGFFVDDGMNETDYVRVVDIQSRFVHGKKLALTIAVTGECNFKCAYCYEQIENPQSMSRETENKIIDYVGRRLERDGDLSVTWYGGEPLLALGTIGRLSEAFIRLAEKETPNTPPISLPTDIFLART
jgi:uncharacterized protein